MNGPDRPTVEPSEPEIVQYLLESAVEKIKSGDFDGLKIGPSYALEYLHQVGLDVDDDGFIIHKESGEYAVPYVFVDDLVKERTRDPDESIFDAFFRPVTDERVHGWDNTRLHLSDLHSVINTENDMSHPVRDDVFDIAEMHARLETRFYVMMSWSDLIKKENMDENGQWVSINDPSGSEVTLNCLNPKCGYSGVASEWDGEVSSPECPDCGGPWDDDNVTVCTVCDHWYWGTHFVGESMYAEPACANCGADMEYLEKIGRYDDVESMESFIEDRRPAYSVVGLDENDEVEYQFDHFENHEDAVREKSRVDDMIGGSIFEDVEDVVIQDRGQLDELSFYEIEEEEEV